MRMVSNEGRDKRPRKESETINVMGAIHKRSIDNLAYTTNEDVAKVLVLRSNLERRFSNERA